MEIMKMTCSLFKDKNILPSKKQNREAILHEIKDFGKRRQDYTMYGTKIFNQETKQIGLLICTWVNVFADGKVDFATCVDSKGKKYNTPMDNISPVEDAEKMA
jgi:hypothetical protein